VRLFDLMGTAVFVGASAGAVFGDVLVSGLRLRRRRTATAAWKRAWSQPGK